MLQVCSVLHLSHSAIIHAETMLMTRFRLFAVPFSLTQMLQRVHRIFTFSPSDMPQVIKGDDASKRGVESVSRIPGFLTPSGQRDFKKFGLNERSMEDWLRLQAEKIAAQKVKFKQGMSWTGARSLYFATRRDTHSDIMCVTTTTRPSNITRCDDGSLPGDGFGLSIKEILAKGAIYGKWRKST